MIFVYMGLSLMVVGTFRTLVAREFRMKLHFIGISDVVGTTLVVLGMVFSRFGTGKVILGYIFMIVWIPLITHALSKAYISRLRR